MATLRHITLTPTDDRGPLPPHSDPPPPSRRGLRLLERLLLAFGIACLGYYAYVSAETALYQAYETRELDAILSSAVPTPIPPGKERVGAARSSTTVNPSRPRPAAGTA